MESFKDIVRNTNAIINNLGNCWIKDAWKDEEKIDKVLNILSDQASKKVYAKEILWGFLNTFLKGELAATMAGMMTSNQWKKHVETMYEKQIHPEMEVPEGSEGTLAISKTTTFILEQYRYGDEVKIEPGDVCLDLGACFGDTTLWMKDNGAKSVFAFEIDPINFGALQKNITNNYGEASLFPINKAIGAKDETVYAITNPYNLGACQISYERPSDIGNFREIECVTIDGFCQKNNIIPTFIKMDIEGTELDAINGGINVFSKMRPKFAICIYHTRSHRWEIPLRLAEICQDYNFFVKKSHPVFETVFYGCPKEKSLH